MWMLGKGCVARVYACGCVVAQQKCVHIEVWICGHRVCMWMCVLRDAQLECMHVEVWMSGHTMCMWMCGCEAKAMCNQSVCMQKYGCVTTVDAKLQCIHVDMWMLDQSVGIQIREYATNVGTWVKMLNICGFVHLIKLEDLKT